MSNRHPILDVALSKKLISKKQYEKTLTKVNAVPGLDPGDFLVEKFYITPDQRLELMELVNSGGDFDSQPPLPPTAEEPVSQPPLGKEQQIPSEPSSPYEIEEEDVVDYSQEQLQPEEVEDYSQQHPSSPQIEPVEESHDTETSLVEYLQLARHWGASDLHLCVGKPPFVRMFGDMRYMKTDVLTPEVAQNLNFQLLTKSQRKRLQEDLNLDFSMEIEGLGRHRCNIFHQRLGWNGVYRIVPNEVPTIDSIGLPDVAKQLTDYHQGLVLVTGPKGCGKTSTVTAMIDHVNKTREDHVITVEEPIEFVHKPIRCQMTQREIGLHSKGFDMALRAALREDPDIILVGEMRDLETISIAMSAGETGHLVFGTLHVSGVARTISRVIDTYPVKQRVQVGMMLSESLRGIISQQLIPRKDNKGMAPAFEILLVTMGVASIIREGNLHQLPSMIQSGKKMGMTTLDNSILKLVEGQIISGKSAYKFAENKQTFEMYKDQE